MPIAFFVDSLFPGLRLPGVCFLAPGRFNRGLDTSNLVFSAEVMMVLIALQAGARRSAKRMERAVQ